MCTDIIVTRGDFDENTKYPDEHVLEIEEFKVGVSHGHQASILTIGLMYRGLKASRVAVHASGRSLGRYGRTCTHAAADGR